MRYIPRAVTVAAAAAALALLAYPSGAGASAVPAGRGGADGAVDAISCASAGNCTAVGHLAPPNRKVLFTVSEKNGVWGTARAVPGTAALLGRKTSGARFSGVSCSSAGNCGAGGSYSPNAGRTRAFVVSEKNGVWGKAKQVTGLAAPAADHFASIDTVTCPSAGTCSAGGSYALGGGRFHDTNRVAFLVSEKHGVWGKAQKVAGLARLNTGGGAPDGPDALFNQISCSSAGNCLAAGFYNGTKGTEPLAVTEKHGVWGSARAFPAIIAINDGQFAELTSVSCTLARNCTAVGFLFFSENGGEVFAMSQKNGIWGPVTGIPENYPSGHIGSLTCLSAGHCTAGGDDIEDLNNTGATQPFIAAEQHGTWTSQRLPGVAELSADTMSASLSGVICRSAGSCSAAGTYGARSGSGVFVSAEQNGTWGTAIDLPGLADLGRGGWPPELSCGAPGDCGLGGFYNAGRLRKPYLASQHQGIWGQAHEVTGIEP